MLTSKQRHALEVAWRLGDSECDSYIELAVRVLGSKAISKLTSRVSLCERCHAAPGLLLVLKDTGLKFRCTNCHAVEASGLDFTIWVAISELAEQVIWNSMRENGYDGT